MNAQSARQLTDTNLIVLRKNYRMKLDKKILGATTQGGSGISIIIPLYINIDEVVSGLQEDGYNVSILDLKQRYLSINW